MGAADRLLRFYPRAWRERYGDEFLATLGPGAPTAQQVIDIIAGAIDAWLSADVRRATRVASAARAGGAPMTLKSLMICEPSRSRYSTRDAAIGAAVMLAATVAFSALGIAARRAGGDLAADILLSLAFPGSLLLSMPFWLLKGQPWKAQLVMVGGTLGFLVAIAYLASLM